MSRPRIPRLDIILSSRELKKLIINRLTELVVSKFQLCEDLNIDYIRFKNYLNSAEMPKVQNVVVSQSELISIASSLGIAVRVTLVILPKEKATAKKFDQKRYDDNMLIVYKKRSKGKYGKET